MKTKFVVLIEVESDTLENAERDLTAFCRIKTSDETLQINNSKLLNFEMVGEVEKCNPFNN